MQCSRERGPCLVQLRPQNEWGRGMAAGPRRGYNAEVRYGRKLLYIRAEGPVPSRSCRFEPRLRQCRIERVLRRGGVNPFFVSPPAPPTRSPGEDRWEVMNGWKPLVGPMVAEFLGTFVLLTLGDGVVAMVTLFGKDMPGGLGMGGYLGITVGWG